MSLNFFGFYELFPIIIQQAYNIVYRKLGNMYKYLYFKYHLDWQIQPEKIIYDTST